MPPVRPLYCFCVVSVAAFATSFAACSRSDAASFDCSKAVGIDEVLICSDQELSELDEELARTYAAIRRAVTGEQWDSLQGNQREWIDRRNVGCQITRTTVVTEENKQLFATCLKTATAERLMFLADLLEVATTGDRESTDDQSARTGSDPDPAVERTSTGSGVIVSEAGLVVTNAHVVDECSDVLIANSRLGVARASVVALDRAADLALLRGDLRPADGVAFRERPVAPGEMIVDRISVAGLAGIRTHC